VRARKRGTHLETEFEAFQLPEMPHVIFEHPPLVLALCQVRYTSVLNVTNASFVAPFQEAIKDQYPVVAANPIHEIGVQFGNSPGEANILQGNPSIQWQFTDQDDNWKIVLTPDFFSIETRVYEHFDDFLDRLRKALNALIQHIKPVSGIRIGLRYVNEIRPSNIDWPHIIRRELLGPVIVPELINNAIQFTAVQQIQLRYPNEQGININHGLLPSGTIVAPRQGEEELLERPFYLLDFDAFHEFPPPKSFIMNLDVICRDVKKYHRDIGRLFKWSVTEQYMSSLEVRHHDTN